MDSRMESLQTELIMDILSRVPTLDLVKLSSICRRWRNIILNDALFRRLHHTRVMSKPNENLVLLLKRGSELYWVDLANKTSPRQVAINLPRIPNFSDYKLVGSCNGLLCLASPGCFSILVVNPFTRHHVLIPMPQDIRRVYSWGFGFDEVAKLFKVVVVFSPCPFICKGVEVRVYELGSTNIINWNWRSIGVTTFPGASILNSSCFFNGRLHWTYRTEDSLDIISFDLADEEVKLIPTPDHPLFLKQKYNHLTVLGGCLSIFQIQIQIQTRPKILIWVMKEYGIKASWEMELNTYPFMFRSLNSDFSRFQVLGSGKDGELIVSGYNRRSLEEAIFLYFDLTCDEFKCLQLERQSHADGAIIHTANLNSIWTKPCFV